MWARRISPRAGINLLFPQLGELLAAEAHNGRPPPRSRFRERVVVREYSKLNVVGLRERKRGIRTLLIYFAEGAHMALARHT